MSTQNTSSARVLPFSQDVSVTPLRDNYNYYYNTRAREHEGTLTVILQSYRDNISREVPKAVERQLLGLLMTDVSPDLIIAVIEYTAITAPRPTWAYASTVLRRQLQAGVKTPGEFDKACDDYLTRAGRNIDLPY